MRSRLPGKLRSSAQLLGTMIVKDRARFTKCRLVMCGTESQILQQTDQAPRQHEAQAKNQDGDRNTHGIHCSNSSSSKLNSPEL
jgi:hypothetical protein